MERYAFRQLERGDHPAVVALHDLIHSTNRRPEVFRRYSPERMLGNLGECGTTFGAFSGATLVAYAAVAFGGVAAEEVVGHVRGLPLTAAHTAVHDGSGVHPDHRGNDLQDQLNVLRLDEAFRRNFRDVVGTVSPQNPYSLKNHFDFDFVVRGFALFYGGLPRVVVHRAHAPTAFGGIDQTLPLESIGEAAGLFDQGYLGVSIQWQADVAYLNLARQTSSASH